MLSCICFYDEDSINPWHYEPENFLELDTTRRKRCKSCKKLINIGSPVLEFEKFRRSTDDIEERCKGDEIKMASLFLCEGCGEIYLNLSDIGYCIDIYSATMQETLSEYHELTGFKATI